MRITREINVEATVEELAACFAELDDDSQSRFFVEVARIMDSWGPGKSDYQLWFIGGHLRNCKCSTPEAREWIKSLAGYIETSTHA